MVKKSKKTERVVTAVIVARKTGNGELYLSRVYDPVNGRLEDLHGHTFYIDNQMVKIGKGNRVTIPAKILEEHGHLRKDGRRAIGVKLVFRHVDGEKVVGARIYTMPNIGDYLENADNGSPVAKEAFEDPEKIDSLHAADIPEFTQSEGR